MLINGPTLVRAPDTVGGGGGEGLEDNSRLVGKYRWREFPVAITGNYRPGKYS